MTVYAVRDPRTGKVLREFPSSTDAEIEAAVSAAHEAHRAWSRRTSVAERAALVRRVAEEPCGSYRSDNGR